MEPISILALAFLTIAGVQSNQIELLESHNNQLDVEITALGVHNEAQEEKIQDLEAWNLRMSGAIAAIFAREKVNHDDQSSLIESHENKIEFLMKK
tara:strand:+ start:493 stop:780 length:288 start_codon:yes stop_codon:yes gene_type:complete